MRDYFRADPLIRRLLNVSLFEDFPTSDWLPDGLFMNKFERCNLYVGLDGNEYGTEDEERFLAI